MQKANPNLLPLMTRGQKMMGFLFIY